LELLKRVNQHLADGQQARDLELSDEEKEFMNSLDLLTYKPTIYIANVTDEFFLDRDDQKEELALVGAFTKKYHPVLPLSIKIEQELVELSEEERQTFLKEYRLSLTGLDLLINASYRLLNLVTFLTTGPMESRAWTVTAGSTAPQAAGKIHSDMERGFIRAETVAYEDLIAAGSYAAARAAGKVRDEGKTYIVQDGDIMLFKFSV
jgi:ribosome-binding ATPase